jgi:hypothetical protein
MIRDSAAICVTRPVDIFVLIFCFSLWICAPNKAEKNQVSVPCSFVKIQNRINPYKMWQNSNIWEFSGLNILKEKGVNYIFFVLAKGYVCHVKK